MCPVLFFRFCVIDYTFSLSGFTVCRPGFAFRIWTSGNGMWGSSFDILQS